MGGPNFVEVDHGLGFTPFILYGEEAIIPLELLVPSLRLAVKFRLGDKESMARRLQKLVTMEEDRNHAEWSTQARQQQRKADTDRRRGGMDAQVFKYNGKSFFLGRRSASFRVNLWRMVQFRGSGSEIATRERVEVKELTK